MSELSTMTSPFWVAPHGVAHCFIELDKTVVRVIRLASFCDCAFLQRAVKRREVKAKGEKERYSHLNAEFPRITRRDKKAFLSDQCKETEENNRIGKTRVLFKKIRDTKGTFHAKMGTIKDRNGMNLTEAEYMKKR